MRINRRTEKKVFLMLILTGLISMVGLTGCNSKDIETNGANDNTEQINDSEQTNGTEQNVTEENVKEEIDQEQNTELGENSQAEDATQGEVKEEQNTNPVDESTKDSDSVETIAQEKTLSQLVKLIGLNKDELEKTINEAPKSIDEGGLEFTEYGVRVWFDENSVVSQVFIMNNEFDLNGVKIGDKISEFTKVFGESIKDTNGDAHYKFDEIFLSVNYDTDTEETYAVYVLKNDF